MANNKKELIELINDIEDEKLLKNLKYIILGYVSNKKSSDN